MYVRMHVTYGMLAHHHHHHHHQPTLRATWSFGKCSTVQIAWSPPAGSALTCGVILSWCVYTCVREMIILVLYFFYKEYTHGLLQSARHAYNEHMHWLWQESNKGWPSLHGAALEKVGGGGRSRFSIHTYSSNHHSQKKPELSVLCCV